MRPGAINSWVAVGIFVALNTSSISAVAQPQELKISHQFAAGVDSRDRAARIFMEEALKRAPHLKISLHPDLSLKIKATEQFRAMVDGELAMSVFPLSYSADKIPEFAIATFPFVPANIDMATRLKGTVFHRKLQSFAEARGIRILTWWWLPGGLASRQREIGAPPTVKGLTTRTPGIDMDRLFVAAGARNVGLISSTEMSAAMRAGKLDFLVTSLESMVSFRIHEQAKFAMIGSVGGFMSLHPLMMSKAVWDGLAADEQQALEDAAEISDRAFEAMQREAEQKAVEAFTKQGVKVRKMSIDEYEAWSRIAKETVWPEYRKISPSADGLFVSLLTSLVQSGKSNQ
jgi:TRAP-type C4-dicarboxylate transport system substrate-binding protein